MERPVEGEERAVDCGISQRLDLATVAELSGFLPISRTLRMIDLAVCCLAYHGAVGKQLTSFALGWSIIDIDRVSHGMFSPDRLRVTFKTGYLLTAICKRR